MFSSYHFWIRLETLSASLLPPGKNKIKLNYAAEDLGGGVQFQDLTSDPVKVVERPKIHLSSNSSLINSVFWTYRKNEIDYRSLSFSQDFLVLHFTQSSGETLDVGNIRKVFFP